MESNRAVGRRVRSRIRPVRVRRSLLLSELKCSLNKLKRSLNKLKRNLNKLKCNLNKLKCNRQITANLNNEQQHYKRNQYRTVSPPPWTRYWNQPSTK